jgi:hypothetical protein
MIFTKKIYPILLICFTAFCSAYFFVSAGNSFIVSLEPDFQSPSTISVPEKIDTPSFSVKKLTHNSYEELNTQLPMDAPTPDNVKSIVEYDIKSGNYVLRTFVGETEIATPFLMTDQEYRNFSAKQEMQRYWKEKNAKTETNNEDKFSVSDMKFNIGAADKVFWSGRRTD